MARRVAIVSAVDPFPTDAGKKVVLAGFIEYFAERHGAENVHYVLVSASSSSHDFPVHVHRLHPPTRQVALGNAALRVSTGRASIQESLLRSSRLGRDIRGKLAELAPDLVVFDTIRLAQYATAEVGARQICYLDDLFSHRYAAMLETLRTHPDVDVRPLGNFAAHVPGWLRPLADARALQRLLLKVERRLVHRTESRVTAEFERVLLISEDEADVLRSRMRSLDPQFSDLRTRVQSTPPLVTSKDHKAHTMGEHRNEFVFLGLLSLPHNDDGLRTFLHEVWPHVVEAMPHATLRVIGREPRDSLIAEVRRHTTVSLDGFIADLDTVLGEATALINPLRFGSGVKLKVIEALSRGLPVVSSPVGAEGIASGPGWGVEVASSPQEWVTVLDKLSDPGQNEARRESARRHYAHVYARDVVFEQYDRAFN